MIHNTNNNVINAERQDKLNRWLEALYNRQNNITKVKDVVIFRLNEGGGFGNVIQGYTTSMLLVIFYDAAFKRRFSSVYYHVVDS